MDFAKSSAHPTLFRIASRAFRGETAIMSPDQASFFVPISVLGIVLASFLSTLGWQKSGFRNGRGTPPTGLCAQVVLEAQRQGPIWFGRKDLDKIMLNHKFSPNINREQLFLSSLVGLF